MNLLKKIFGSYKQEQEGRYVSEHRKRMLQVDENYAMLVQMRDNENDDRKNKRMVNCVGVDRKTGKTVRYTAGILAVRDHGSVQEKLRGQFGGKRMRRILKAEKRAARENPEALTVVAIDGDARHTLTRGVDFAMVRDHGESVLVLHDAAKQFEASYSNDFAASLS